MILEIATLGVAGDSMSARSKLIFLWDLAILKSTTWYLNKTEMRAWAHFPVVEEIDGREMRVKKGKNSLKKHGKPEENSMPEWVPFPQG